MKAKRQSKILELIQRYDIQGHPGIKAYQGRHE